MTAHNSPTVAPSFALALVLILSGLSPVAQTPAAQTPIRDRSVGVRAGSINRLPAAEKRWALIIGIDDYKGFSTLRGAVRDANALAAALEQYAGFPRDNIIRLTTDQENMQPTRSKIIKELSLMKKRVSRDGLLLIAFSGHGIERNNKSFLVPVDGEDLDSATLMEDQAINVDKVSALIEETGVEQVVLLLDACRNDPTAGKSGGGDNRMSESLTRAFDFTDRNKNIKAFVTLYATKVGERAYEYAKENQGYFTYTFIEGLKGGAANPETGEVTLHALANYVQERVPKYVKRDMPDKTQVPLYKIEGFMASELVLAKHTPKDSPTPVPVVPVRPSTGKLFVSSSQGASIKVAAAGWNGPTRAGQVSAADGSYQLNELPPGRYVVTASLAGHREESKEVNVTAGEQTLVILGLTVVKHRVVVTANVAEGTVKLSAPGEPARLIPWRSGRADLGSLSPGDYEIEMTAREVGYQPRSERLSVRGDVSRHYDLARNLSRLHYICTWKTFDGWTAPRGWVMGSDHMSVRGSGVAVLRDENYANYADGRLTADVKLTNGVGIAFVLRYADQNNYYYIHVTGNRGAEPYLLRGYLVKDGVTRKIYSNNVSWLSQYLRPDQPIRLMIEINGNSFKVSMDSDGEIRMMGEVRDPYDVLRSGSIGLAALGSEQTEVYGFIFTPKPVN